MATAMRFFSSSANMSITFALPARPATSTRMRRDISAEIATALIVALAIHSTTDGLALGDSDKEAPVPDATKWSLFSALCIHKVPEGLALGSLLDRRRVRRAAALGWVAAVEATTLIGGVIGIFLSGERFGLLAGPDHGACRRRIFLSGGACCARGNVEAWKETCANQFFRGSAIIATLNIALRLFG